MELVDGLYNSFGRYTLAPAGITNDYAWVEIDLGYVYRIDTITLFGSPTISNSINSQ